ncbi:hypothetical protein KAU86_02455 [bacterium]|nr:hypothetical protein [bacterium]MCK4436789.1 hypothetical protein [bacterium]
MKIIEATILDPTHLELKQPISAQQGEHIQISIPDEREEDRLWQEAARKHFLETYGEQDAMYDEL